MLKTVVPNCQIMKVLDNQIESRNGGEPIKYKTCIFFNDMDSYTMSVEKSVVAKIKPGTLATLTIGWDVEKRNGFSKYKPKIYDYSEMK